MPGGVAVGIQMPIDATKHEAVRPALGVTSRDADAPPEPPPSWREERDRIRAIEEAHREYGPRSKQLIAPLQELATFYVSSNRCEDAIPVWLEALKVSRTGDGLFNPQQMQFLDPLLECYLALDLQDDFDRELRYALLISEQANGRSDLKLLPALIRTARWYEQAGRYISARIIYNRAVGLVRKAAGKRDPRMVAPLRGVARAYRLEYIHGLNEADNRQYPQHQWRSRARLRETPMKLDLEGSSSLVQALKILQAHPDADRAELLDTLLELADWRHMEGSWNEALILYKQAWRHSATNDYTGPRLFVEPEPIFYRTDSATLLRQLPYQRDDYDRYWVEFTFTVTRRGQVANLMVTNSNAPKSSQQYLARAFESTRYRPQFEQGEPIDAPGCRLRQGLFVKR